MQMNLMMVVMQSIMDWTPHIAGYVSCNQAILDFREIRLLSDDPQASRSTYAYSRGWLFVP